jgi:hypothetical protein
MDFVAVELIGRSAGRNATVNGRYEGRESYIVLVISKVSCGD